LLEVEPENRRAQDSLKKLYLEQKGWDDLESFYAGQQKWDEFIRVLGRQVDSESPESRLALHFKIANMYRDRLSKPDRAMRAYERVLQLDERNLQAAEALIPLYEQANDNRKLVGVLEIQHGHSGEGEERLGRLRRLAELCETTLKDKGAAYGWWIKAFAENVKDEDIRAQVERLAGETGGWVELVTAYEAGL